MVDKELIVPALRAYLHRGDSAYPKPDPANVLATFGEHPGAELLALIEALTNELGAINVDWKSLGWQGGLDYAMAEMKRRHPELPPGVFVELDWLYSYQTR